MAQKPISSTTSNSPAPTRSEVRNTPIPRQNSAAALKAASKQISRESIAKRAYEIWQSGQGGSERDNWLRAERELRG
jgi:hypothetical protein